MTEPVLAYILADLAATLPPGQRTDWCQTVRNTPDGDGLGWRFIAWLLSESGFCTSRATNVAEMLARGTDIAEQLARGQQLSKLAVVELRLKIMAMGFDNEFEDNRAWRVASGMLQAISEPAIAIPSLLQIAAVAAARIDLSQEEAYSRMASKLLEMAQNPSTLH